MASVTVEVDVDDLSPRDRRELIRQLWTEMSNPRASWVSDLVDARDELLRHRPSEALIFLERALKSMKEEAA